MTPDRIARRVRAMARAAALGESTASIADRLRADIFALSIREDWRSRSAVYESAGIALPALPEVPNVDQIRALRGRLPWAERLADVYDEHARTAARLAEDEAASYAREVIADSLEVGGGGRDAAVAQMARDRGWADSYGEMCWRTNATEAAVAGQFAAAADPDVSRVLPAIIYEAIRDPDVRRGRKQDGGENHLALDGLIGPADWPGWREIAPPNGYSCRCGVRLVHRRELEARGALLPDGTVPNPTIPPAFRAHPDFQGPKLLDRF